MHLSIIFVQDTVFYINITLNIKFISVVGHSVVMVGSNAKPEENHCFSFIIVRSATIQRCTLHNKVNETKKSFLCGDSGPLLVQGSVQ